jgi:hypothetical protein
MTIVYIIGAALVGLLVVGALMSVAGHRTKDAVTCPRCQQTSFAFNVKCRNCGHQGARAKVIVNHSVRSVFWRCETCQTPIHMQCEHCGTSLHALYSR